MDFHFTIKTLKVWDSLELTVGTDKDRAENPDLKTNDYTLQTVWDESLTNPVGYEVVYKNHSDEFDFRYTAEMLNDAIRRYRARYPYFHIDGIKHDSETKERVYTHQME